jgi:hypothetical protein
VPPAARTSNTTRTKTSLPMNSTSPYGDRILSHEIRHIDFGRVVGGPGLTCHRAFDSC